jgi:uncharacterized pyridoxamine 5'-phosphate oxidase family protein
MTTQFLFDFIAKNKYAVLATVAPDNSPEAAVIGIAATKDLEIIFDTVSTSRKYQNLIKNPSIAFVIGWDDEKTVQYEGIAKIPDTNELDGLLKIYFEVFPDGRERKENWKDIVYFYVEPKWIRYSDFRTPLKIEEKTF